MPPDSYIEDALEEKDARAGYVLACQMRPTSDCVVRIPATSAACKTGVGDFPGKVATVEELSPSTIRFSVAPDHPELLDFLPGQYVNVTVPGTDQTRSYSFASAPGADNASFVVRNVPDGLMSTWLTGEAKPGAAISFSVRQLLPAARPAPRADAGRRHRHRAVPGDAGRAGGEGIPASGPPRVCRHQRP
jgi:benzoate/toluate 1,2-dioxygenase reductase subunit